MKHAGIVFLAVLLLSIGTVVPAAAAPVASTCGATYTVARGDTLARIASRCGTTISAILAANPNIRNANLIYTGQRLHMPGGSTGPQPGPVGGTTYIVRRGDTLANIAARFGVTTTALLRANPQIRNANYITVGQKLTIPGSTAPVFSTVNIALINVGGGTIGCSDGIVMVQRNVAATQAPLTAAIGQLLSIKQQNYGQSGLYNALYASNLSIQSISIVNGKALIYLVGQLSSGGVCDDPRIIAQFHYTATQFSTVSSVQVYVNGIPLESLLSGHG